MLAASPGGTSGGQRRACTPEALRGLPAEARQDLRRITLGLEARLLVPAAPERGAEDLVDLRAEADPDEPVEQAPGGPAEMGGNPMAFCPLVL